MIPEAIPKQIDSVYVSGIRVNANPDADVGAFIEIQVSDADITDLFVVEIAAERSTRQDFRKPN